ncbi:type II secretion system F family protein [Gordonia sp. NPDC003376]
MSPLILLCLAAACWCWPGPRWRLCRVTGPPPRRTGEPRWPGLPRTVEDPFAVAACLDLFAVCLRAGLPVSAAARVAAGSAPESLAVPLTATAELLELGADPDRAWAVTEGVAAGRFARRRTHARPAVHFDDLATLARRSARSGSALSQGVSGLADSVRRQAHDDALARAERAGVMVSGPLGLCFLPAFICLGIVPVVIGLATRTLGGI